MAFRLLRAGAVGGALLAAAAASAQTSISSGPARSVDLRTAPQLQNPPIPPLYFDRPTPRVDHRAVHHRSVARTKRLPPDATRDR